MSFKVVFFTDLCIHVRDGGVEIPQANLNKKAVTVVVSYEFLHYPF